VKERLEVSTGVNSSLEVRQVVVIQPLVSNVKVKLLDEKGVEVRGCRTTKVGGFTIGFEGCQSRGSRKNHNFQIQMLK